MRRTFRLFAFSAALAAALPAPARAFVADATSPSVSNFGITDCEGNLQNNAVTTSTGLATVRIRVFDQDGSTVATRPGMGGRVGLVQHVGGQAAGTHLINLMHFDGNTTSSDTAPNNGTLSGVVACGSGNGHTGLAGDDCYTWDSAGDFVRVNVSPTLNSTTSQLTLQAWIKPSNITTAVPILEFNNNTNLGPHLWHSFNGNGTLFANLIDTNGVSHVVASTAGFVKANVWQLATLSYNGTVARLYYNDVEIASRPFSSMPPLQTSYNLFVGRRPSAADTFAGSIDEVRVLNRALSDDEAEGDPYSGVLFFKTTTTFGTPFQQVKLVPGTHYTPVVSNGFQTPATATVTNLQLKPGGGNQLAFSFQDLVGNTRRTQLGITVIETVPDAPLNVTAGNVTTGSIDWSWTRGTRLCKTTGGGGGQFIGRRADTGAVVYPANTTASFTEGSLAVNTLYGLHVVASDAFGTSPLSTPASAYTLAVAPTGFGSASVSTGSAVISWSSTNPGYTRFEVVLSTDNFAFSFSTVSIANNLTALTTSFASLSPQTTYFVRVRAFNGRASDTVTAGTAFTSALTGQFNTLPAAPGTLSGAALGPTSIRWAWTLVPTATSYTLLSSTGTSLAETSGNSHTVTNLTPNASYGARLRAHNLNGSGDFGDLATTFTDPHPPTGSAVAQVTTSTARLTWNGNGNPNGTSYQVQVATLNGFGSVLSAVSVTANEATFLGLLPASTYYARVRASGFNGNATAFDTALSFVTSSFGAISSTAAPPTPYAVSGPEVGVWHFDETGGTRAADSSSFANHLAITASLTNSSPTFVAGQDGLGKALRFPGLLESVAQAPHSASLATTGDLTVEIWANPAASLQVQDAGVVVKGAGTEESFMLDVSTSLKWRFAVRDAGGTLWAVFSTSTLRPNAWAHLAGVYRSGGSPSLSLYVDGTLSATMTAAPAARRTTVNSLSVGNRRSAASSFDRAFRGDLDELHIATTALNSAQVGADYAASRPATVIPPSPNDGVRIVVPPNAFGGAAVILMSSSPLTVPISISRGILADGIGAPPSGQTLVPNSVFEIVANVNGGVFTGQLASTVTLGLPYPDADGNGLVDGTSPPIPVESLKVYTLNTAVTSWDALPSTVDTANKRVLGQTTHFSVFALFGPTGIKPNTDQIRLYPRPWKPGSAGKFDSVTFGGRTGLAIDNLTSSGHVRIFTLAGEMVRELAYGASNVGTLIWDGTNHAGARVASGVYFALVIPDDGETVVIKFAVER
ncbi:hypothetical protein EPO15_02255 [bacterium]|nr:MAG: hypothetical protein EPO15_02255 [bacterium]